MHFLPDIVASYFSFALVTFMPTMITTVASTPYPQSMLPFRDAISLCLRLFYLSSKQLMAFVPELLTGPQVRLVGLGSGLDGSSC